MAKIFGRKTDTSASSPAKKRKDQTLLSSVIHESAVGAAVDLLKQNHRFALPNGTSWVGLLLSAEDIGGLSQKHNKDAVKGSIIELIASDKIEVVATQEMLDLQYFGIIPSPSTLARMGEYSLLTDAPYHWVTFRIDDDGETLRADHTGEATFAKALAISNGDLTVAEVVPMVWAWATGESAPSASSSNQSEFDHILAGTTAPSAATASVGGDSATTTLTVEADPLADAFGGDSSSAGGDFDFSALSEEINWDAATGVVEDEPDLQINVEQFEAQIAEPFTEQDEEPIDLSWNDTSVIDSAADSPEADDEGYFKYVADNRDRVVEEEEVRDTIVRRFLSDDLDLVVDTEEFDRVFDSEAEAILIEIPDANTDWLGSQVAQLTRQANAELAQLHRDHQDTLREKFVETTALHVEKTMALLSTDNPGSQYGNLLDGAKRDFENRRAQAPVELAEQRRELIARFEAQAQSRADQAAAHARATFEDKHRPKLDRDIAELGRDQDRRTEEGYAHDKGVVLEMRRREARTRMEVGTNRIFELLRDEQATQREAQRALLNTWNLRLIQFIDENRKEDLARAMVLAEELARSTKLDELRAEHAEIRRADRETSEARERQLDQEIRRIRAEAASTLEASRREWNDSLTLAKNSTEQGSVLIERLQQQNADLAGQYERKYEARIAELEADRDGSERQLEQANKLHRRMIWMFSALTAVLLLAGVVVGIIAGWSYAQQQTLSVVSSGFAVMGSYLL